MDDTRLIRSLGSQDRGQRPSEELCRDLITSIMMVLNDTGSSLSDDAITRFQRLLGVYREAARVRFARVLIYETARNLHYKAKTPGCDDRRARIEGIAEDWLNITDGRWYGNDKSQMVVYGTLESTGETAYLYFSSDEPNRELVILENDPDQ